MKLSVIIPAYNEEKDIKQAIVDVYDRFPNAQIIVINDASTDATSEVLQGLKGSDIDLHVLNNVENCGHGYSVMKGLRFATGDYILYIDADRQIELRSLPMSADIVSGWRGHRHDKLFRKIVSFFLRMTIFFRFGMYIKDANCPFKFYKREALLPLLSEVPETHVIPIACIEVLARKHDLDVVTIPTPHLPYQGVRDGFLQLPNKQFFIFCYRAFREITSL